MATRRRDELLAIQEEVQARWATEKTFETERDPSRPKYFVTFPYPYMNGFLHMGHAFSLSKTDFAVGYQALKGCNVLFPFGFHCTGMPIQASAGKIKREIEKFGCPPEFPAEGAEEPPSRTPAAPAQKGKSGKSKAVAKAGPARYTWQIMEQSGVPVELLRTFDDPVAWLRYFPGEGMKDMKYFGAHVDWRRSFITTSVNPFYDAFIRWQFNTLRKLGRVKFGKRLTVYSPLDGQACADHDRASGEGVGPQEYTLIKMAVKQGEIADGCNTAVVSLLNDHPNTTLYLAAATLRPETMYGQTNCWVLPTGEYVAVRVSHEAELWVVTERAARNMSYQGLTPKEAHVDVVARFVGSDLIGLPLKAPNAVRETVYVLPLLSVSTSKGTGVVTSVPSDAPDDYRGLKDLQDKEPMRRKFNLSDEWVVGIEPVPIIDVPEYGTLAAVAACEKFKVKSQNDRAALDKAKDEVYKKGFYGGRLTVGRYAGEMVEKAKTKIKEEMIGANMAVLYSEPEKTVISRSGDECVVALIDQWYLDYGDEEWTKVTKSLLDRMELFHDETRNLFVTVLDWLHEWACSRSFGLGTQLPWDTQFVIESLSDSTIYMAYYTISHLLQGENNLDGSERGPLGLEPAMMTDPVFDYVFRGLDIADADRQASGISQDALEKLRSEFLYWYPMDLRSSGKELIGNHLTFCLYNHTALFPEKLWPQSMRTNGHMLINAEKMSKSTGNFITLREGIHKFSADGIRFALADAGDTVDDANFAEKMADEAILKLTTFLAFVRDGFEHVENMKKGPVVDFHERVFEAAMNKAVHETDAAYDKMMFRDALKHGFFELQDQLGQYRVAVGADQGGAGALAAMHQGLFLRYIEWQALLIAPICPHTSEHVWSMIAEKCGKERTSIFSASWPSADKADEVLLSERLFLDNLLYRVRIGINPKKKKKGVDASAKFTKVTVYVCKELPEWQAQSVEILRTCLDPKTGTFPNDVNARVMANLPQSLKTQTKKIMPFVGMVRDEVKTSGVSALDRTPKFDEETVLLENKTFILSQVGLEDLAVMNYSNAPEGDKKVASEALPLKPGFSLQS